MKRVLIIGSNGAGKSTFSYKLSSKMNLPLIHIDKIYWRENWKVTPKEQFETIVLEEVKKDQWIIEGNNIHSLSQRLIHADTVIWFEFPPLICIWNVLKREMKYLNKARPDMPEGCISKLSLKFLKDVWSFNKKNHQRIEEMLSNTTHLEVIRFTNYKQVNSYLNKI